MMRERQSAADPLGPAASRVMPCRQSHYGLCVMCLAADAIFEGECCLGSTHARRAIRENPPPIAAMVRASQLSR
jgi:hypothetical protein